MCQECFFAGRGGKYKNHKMTHPMQEYCTTVGQLTIYYDKLTAVRTLLENLTTYALWRYCRYVTKFSTISLNSIWLHFLSNADLQ